MDPSQCTIEFQAMSGILRAYVQTVDTTGRLMITGGAKVEATQDGWGLDVQDNNNGTYTFECDTFLEVLYVKINGIPMKGSPFNPEYY